MLEVGRPATVSTVFVFVFIQRPRPSIARHASGIVVPEAYCTSTNTVNSTAQESSRVAAHLEGWGLMYSCTAFEVSKGSTVQTAKRAREWVMLSVATKTNAYTRSCTTRCAENRAYFDGFWARLPRTTACVQHRPPNKKLLFGARPKAFIWRQC